MSRSSRVVTRAPPVLALILVGGCFAGRGSLCEEDADCAGECTRTGECVEAGSSIRVVVAWTVNGLAPSEEACASLGDLGVVFYDGGQEARSYYPIPCPIGRSTYDKMPPRLDRVELVAEDPSGRTVDRAERDLAPTGETVVEIDLRP